MEKRNGVMDEIRGLNERDGRGHSGDCNAERSEEVGKLSLISKAKETVVL